MSSKNEILLIQSQFDVVWKLAQLILPKLITEDHFWEPVLGSWSMRKNQKGWWKVDLEIPEPEPTPTSTIAWLTWHIQWWWSSFFAVYDKKKPFEISEIAWPGNASEVNKMLNELHDRHAALLASMNEAALSEMFEYPWQKPRQFRFALGWVNIELMKNVAEIGQVYHYKQFKRENS